MYFKKNIVLSMLVTGIGGMSHDLLAEEIAPSLEELIVTAQIRADHLQEVPVSLSAVSGERLYEVGINDLEGLTPYVPNFSMNQTGISSIITIRGINSGINQGFEQSIGMYVDGLSYGRAQLSRAPLFDLQRVEVLRGPQTILFGKSSIAGAVSQVTRKPTFAPDGFLSVEYVPEFNAQDYRFAIGGGITEQLAGRFSALYRTEDGWVENTLTGEDESQSKDSVLRGSLVWQPSDRLSFWLKGEKTRWDVSGRNIEVFNSITHPDPAAVTGDGGSLPPGIQINHIAALNGAQAALGRPRVDGELNYRRDSNGDTSDNTVENIAFQVDYEVAEAGTLTLLTGYLSYDYQELCDCDYTLASIFDVGTEEKYRQLSQQIRFSSARGNFIDYIAGFYFQNSEQEFQDSINVTDDSLLAALSPAILGTATQREFEQNTRLWSAFGQLTMNFTDRVRLTLGGRYSYETKEATRGQAHVDATGTAQGSDSLLLNTIYNSFAIESYGSYTENRSETNFSPLVTVQWDVVDNTMLYATAVRGFKSGGYDVRSNAHPDPAVVTPGTSPDLVGVFEYDPELARSFELGVKSSFADRRAEINVALFRMEFDDQQTSQFDGTLGFNVTNAGKAYSQGLEGDFRWLVTPGLILGGNLAWLDFEYTEFPNSQCYFGQSYLEPDTVSDPGAGLCNAEGKRKEYTPEWRAALNADWVQALGGYLEFRAVLDLMYTDAYLWNPTLDPRSEQDAYIRLDARLSLGSQDGKWVVALVGRNLTDETVVNFGGNTPLAGTLTQGTGNSYYGFVQKPASVGLQVTYNFF